MSEPTLAELASAALPAAVKEVEGALAPEAAKVLGDLREFVSGEADRLRTELPQVVENGVAHLHALGEAILNRYHSVMERIDAHLGGVPVPTQPAASTSTTTGASDTSSPVVVGEPGPEAPAPTTDTLEA